MGTRSADPDSGRSPRQRALTGPFHEEATILSADFSAPTSFAELGVRDDICQALSGVGITAPFPIQAMCIPIAVQGTDLIGQARTGTGKTLAFGVTILQRITLPGDDGWDELVGQGKPQALVMCPTRELALQVSRDIATAASVRGARVLTVYGGVGYDPQIDALKSGVDVVVGTPGRLLDLAHRKDLDLSHARITVLDEADEMLDLGFLPDVERLLAMTSTNRQSMLFSATMPAAIMALARAHLNKPVHIRAEGADAQATVPDTTQFVYQAHAMDKIEVIARILQARDVEKVMIFCRTRRACQRLADDLEDRGFKARAIHGDLTQVAREKALKKFRSGDATILVATDVAARGIDVTGVSHVINHECPDDEKTYVHRIGRTGRAGAKGIAVTLVDWADVTRWKMINKALDLGIDDPVVTFSTSPHLYTDLDIPEGTVGFLPGSDPATREPRRRDDDRHGHHKSHDDSRRDGERKGHARKSGDRPEKAAKSYRPKRKRTRRRNGEVVASGEDLSSTEQVSAPSDADAGERPRRERTDAGRSGHDGAREDRAQRDGSKHDRTRHDKTEHEKTPHEKSRHDKGKRDKDHGRSHDEVARDSAPRRAVVETEAAVANPAGDGQQRGTSAGQRRRRRTRRSQAD
ncbi:DEAD/DEAH box helicase [Acidipropionibacterium jensenii]|uniref:DEAD/DEAH box helicase n=1 Tax=Acidipropionibacterium jensenii TaxID=1749 RepID=UPI0026472D1D|nr:DEAD/DEAH box helicase [Acidipropionibacterium jensenii]MDN5977598.1 DEAD/DEAH box helicase [Acidipropionibacterium jensenii]MDN5996572.1 DEAD/DEAH box helicase [Acidipropionibacterium jensenii]MDN6427423.1 DEAD/DEAH box helicase [Acidipropionibacterium jensenii]MDN6442014.1 DEAD/DEAH box helicase [Acidipropionibacterium jensenii]MDN6481382.1 DEAD/DEAH box helicase [Acidipropionibacterium jensenii]